MTTQTLDQLWKSLDVQKRADLTVLLANELFVEVSTFNAWRRGDRSIPKLKKQKLINLVKEHYSTSLQV